MPRIKFEKGAQGEFLLSLREKLGMTWPQLSEKIRVHPRSLSDWRREKYTIPEKVFKKLIVLGGERITIPDYEVLPDFWSIGKAASEGGLARMKKYGELGTTEGRRKGGFVSQKRRRLHPELYQHCNLRKNITKPRYSCELAEFFGIMLGDGGINSDYQGVISLHRENDREYAVFVCNMIERLFAIVPAVYHYRSVRSKNVVGIVVSSTTFLEFLLLRGLQRGSKVKHQAGVPVWIERNTNFSKHCLRGLIDTDGGVYYHRHRTRGYKCFNIGLCFTSRSLPLIDFAESTLLHLGFTPKRSSDGFNVHLYRQPEVLRYAEEIGFHNPHHAERIKKFTKMKQEGWGV